MNLPAPAPMPELCPLCGAANQCAMEAARRTGDPQPACWCTQAGFPAGLLQQLPAAARGVACICRACVEGARLK